MLDPSAKETVSLKVSFLVQCFDSKYGSKKQIFPGSNTHGMLLIENRNVSPSRHDRNQGSSQHSRELRHDVISDRVVSVKMLSLFIFKIFL